MGGNIQLNGDGPDSLQFKDGRTAVMSCAARVVHEPHKEPSVACSKSFMKRARRKVRALAMREKNLEFDRAIAAVRELTGDHANIPVAVKRKCKSDNRKRCERPAGQTIATGLRASRNEPLEAVWEANREGLDADQSRQLRDLLFEFRDAFALDGEPLGQTSLVEHHKDNGVSRPIRCNPRRLARDRQAATDSESDCH